jgi:ribose transport system permease protein
VSNTSFTGGTRFAALRPSSHTVRLALVVLFIIVLIVVGSTITDRFARGENFLNIYEQSTDLALVSLGQTLTILTGGIDLSVGSMISLLSTLTSGLINSDQSMVLPVCAGIILLGLAIGAINCLGVVFLKIHPLIVTLGMGAVLQGVVLLYARGPAGGTPDGFDFLAYGRIYDVSFGATITIVLYLIVALLMRKTATGRAIYAVGDEPAAAVLLGLPVRRVTVLVYALSGFFCALTAIYLVSRFGTGQPYAGQYYTLQSVTPVVVGGTLLSGGRGGVIGTLLGAYLLAVLNNLLNFMHVSTQIQLIAQGLIIMAAVSAYVERKKVA